jgi:hypothetical protein
MSPARVVTAKNSCQMPAPIGRVLRANAAAVSTAAVAARSPPRQITNTPSTGSQLGLHAKSPMHAPASALRPEARQKPAAAITSARTPLFCPLTIT